MSNRAGRQQPTRPGGTAPSPRIVDLVFARDARRTRSGPALAVAATALFYGLIAVFLFETRLSLESWSADVAARVHAELSRHDEIELEAPPPPAAPPPPVVEPEPPAPSPIAPPPVARAPSRHVAPAAPAPPAQAGQVIAREADPNEPVDLTGNTFVTGSGSAYAGGATTATGKNKQAVDPASLATDPAPASTSGQSGAPSQARPVELDEPDWRCPWPREADAEEIDEQVAVVRVHVRADGTVESAEIVADPGHGFGPAALDCARRARFRPALDRDGHPRRAASPPIRVHFVR